MLSNTNLLIDKYTKVLVEQSDQMPSPEEGFNTTGADPNSAQDVTQNPAPAPQEEMPMTSEGEEKYIADLVDAALYQPSSEDVKTLTNLQSVLKMKKYTNAREEILPMVLNIIRPSTESNDIRSTLAKI